MKTAMLSFFMSYSLLLMAMESPIQNRIKNNTNAPISHHDEIYNNMQCAMSYFPSYVNGASVYMQDGTLAVNSGTTNYRLNYVLPNQKITDPDNVIDIMHKFPTSNWFVSPQAETIGDTLTTLGYIAIPYSLVAFYALCKNLNLAAVPDNPQFHMHVVDNHERLTNFAQIYTHETTHDTKKFFDNFDDAGLNNNAIRAYVGYLNNNVEETPVATGVLAMVNACAGIYSVYVDSTQQKTGIAKLMTKKLIQEACNNSSISMVTLQTNIPFVKEMLKVYGFNESNSFTIFTPPL